MYLGGICVLGINNRLLIQYGRQAGTVQSDFSTTVQLPISYTSVNYCIQQTLSNGFTPSTYTANVYLNQGAGARRTLSTFPMCFSRGTTTYTVWFLTFGY